MRNYKKAIMLLLALVVLFAAGVVASADISSNDSDDFNAYTSSKSFTVYPSGENESAVLSAPTAPGKKNYFHIVTDAGPDASPALRMHAESYEGTSNLLTKPFDSTTGETIVLAYDMRIDAHHGYNPGGETHAQGKKTSLAGGLFEMHTSEDTINPTGTDKGENFQYEIGKWYNVTIVRDNASISAYIVDGETGETCTYSKKSSAGKADDSITILNVPAIINCNTFDAYVDNLTMTTYDPETQAPSVVGANVEDGETGVLLNKEIIVEFDQLFLDSTPTPTVYAGETRVTSIVEKLTPSKVKISFANYLSRETEYTVSFEGVTNGSVACNSDSLTFTTEGLHLWNDVEISPIAADIVTNIEFTIGEEFGYTKFSGKILVAVYSDGVMTKLIPITLVNQNVTESISRDISLGLLESGDEIKVMLIDDVEGIVPLAVGSTIVE